MTVTTHTQITRDLRLAARQGLLPARGSGWLSGFVNMLGKELGEWFHTRRLATQLLFWLIFINGFSAYILFGTPQTEATEHMGLNLYLSMVFLAGSIGVIILAQDEVIQEKQSGTAAWILSKPAARPAFILTKLLSNIVGALVFIVALPGLVTLGEIYLATHRVVPLVPFLAGVGVVLLALVFYVSLVILLGVLFTSRGPVLGIALGIVIGGLFFGQFFPQVAYVLPVSLDRIALAITQGMPLAAMDVSELIATIVMTVVFIPVALWRFQHKEF